MKYKISCIVPIHNQNENFLRKCLESILHSDYENLEILLINSESTNNVQDVIDSYNDPRINKYYKKDEGVVKNYQFGVFKATGQYIVFVDSDDYIDSGLFKYLDEIINISDYDLISYNYSTFCGDSIKKVNENNKRITSYYSKNSMIDDIFMIEKYGGMRWRYCFKKDLFLEAIELSKFQGCIYENFGEDVYIVLCYLALVKKNIAVTRDIYYFWRQNPKSETKKLDFAAKINSLSSVNDRLIELVKNKLIEEKIYRDYYVYFVNLCFAYFCMEHNKNKLKDLLINKDNKRYILKALIKQRFGFLKYILIKFNFVTLFIKLVY